MAYTTVNKSLDFFNTVLYTSTGNDNLAITGVGFEADLTWIKKRAVVSGSNTNEAHYWVDQVRGYSKWLSSSSNNGEQTYTNDLKSWQSDGFTLGTNNRVNQGSTPHTYASWNWKANGQGSANTDGSINTTYTSVNTTAGFSISKWTGTGSNATVGHGLGVAPKMVINKRIDGGTNNWVVGHGSIGFTENIYLNLNNAKATDPGSWNDTAPTNSVFSVGTNNESNGSGSEFITYCFAEKQGYSKFGSFTVNSNSTNFIYTGFKPKFIIMKQYSSTSGNAQWGIFDDKREGFNGKNNFLYANTEASEDSSNAQTLDFLSNGFKLRGEYVSAKAGESNIFMAIGQSLVGSNNVPCTAR
jgi:hypothetical protein